MNEFSIRRGLIASCLATLMALAPGITATAEEALSDTQRAAVEALIERYIQENPDHILDSVRQYREREETRIAAEQQSNLSNLKREIQFDPAAPVAGNSEGSVTVVEFFDYRCGYCKASLEMVMNLIREDPDVRVVFKELPILSPESVRAAQAALAAQRQGRYLDLHYAMMASRGQFDDKQIFDIASEVGLDLQQLKADMESPEILALIDTNKSLAGALGIGGTPTFIVDDQIFRGAIDAATMRKAIAEARAG